VIVTQVFPAPDTQSDFQKLATEYKLSKSYTAMEGYVYARVLVEAIRRTGPKLSRESLTETLQSRKPFDMGSYSFTFDPKNRTGSTSVDLTMITKNGRFMR
jgi:ABC-type branched-subunit amino acid transport system substrate-binding protein